MPGCTGGSRARRKEARGQGATEQTAPWLPGCHVQGPAQQSPPSSVSRPFPHHAGAHHSLPPRPGPLSLCRDRLDVKAAVPSSPTQGTRKPGAPEGLEQQQGPAPATMCPLHCPPHPPSLPHLPPPPASPSLRARQHLTAARLRLPSLHRERGAGPPRAQLRSPPPPGRERLGRPSAQRPLSCLPPQQLRGKARLSSNAPRRPP